MKISRESVEPRQVRLTVVAEPAQVEAVRRELSGELSKRYRIPGFRPGKAPFEHLVAVLGKQAVDGELFDRLGRMVVQAAVKAEDLEPASQVQVELTEVDPPTFVAMVPLSPMVDLGDYRALRVAEAEPVEITDEAIDRQLEVLRREVATRRPVDRPAEAGDLAGLRIVGRLRQPAAAEPKAESDGEPEPAAPPAISAERVAMPLTEEGVAEVGLPPGFADEVVGLSAGETARFTLAYPEGSQGNIPPGEAIDFEVELLYLAELEVPELDDAFAARVAGKETLEELREHMRAFLAQRRGMEAHEQRVREAEQLLVDGATVTYPPQMVLAELDDLVAEFRERLGREGIEWADWLRQREADEEAIVGQFEREAEQRLRARLVVRRFMEAEALDIDRPALEDAVRRRSSRDRHIPRKRRADIGAVASQAAAQMLMSQFRERLLAIASGQAEAEPEPAAAPDPA